MSRIVFLYLSILFPGILFADDKIATVPGTVPDRTWYSPDFTPIENPNILFIFADDIGYEALNSYGGLDFKTPRLDRMAAEGIRFTRMHTTPVCTPSRVSMHTGMHVPRHGHIGVLPVHKGTDKKVDFQSMPTYAQSFREAGFFTATSGKWQLATLEVWPNHVRNAGFDHWCVWQIWRDGEKTLRHWNATFNRDGKVLEGIADRFGPDVLKDYVAEQMKAATDSGKPFMILHNELLPHYPIIDTPEDRANNRKASLGNMIHYMDKLVGDLLDEVEKLGIRDRTYVIFMGDNGTLETDFQNPHYGKPGEKKHTRHTTAGLVNGGKNQLNDAGSHVPFIVWGPKQIPAGAVCRELIDVVDLFPTFCQLAGIAKPENAKLDGRSIAAQIHGKPGLPRDWVHHQLRSGINVFDGNFRLHSKGKFIDARELPAETEIKKTDSETGAAKDRLKAIVEGIGKSGPAPPLTF